MNLAGLPFSEQSIAVVPQTLKAADSQGRRVMRGVVRVVYSRGALIAHELYSAGSQSVADLVLRHLKLVRPTCQAKQIDGDEI